MPLEPTEAQLRDLDLMLNRAISSRKIWAVIRDHVLEAAVEEVEKIGEGDIEMTIPMDAAARRLRALKGPR